MMDLGASHQSYFSSSNNTRKRFFTNGEGPQELPMLTPLSASPSSGNLRLAPGRSLSSSAAQIRQRGSPTSSPTGSFIHKPMSSSYSDLDNFLVHKPQPQHQQTPSFYSTLCQGLLLVVFTSLCIFGMMCYESNHELQHLLELRNHEIDHHLEHVQTMERKIQRLRTETLHLHQQMESLEQQEPSHGLMEMQRELFHLEHAQTMMQQGVQLTDERMVVEEYGPGPFYYVEMQLQFPDSPPDAPPSIILLETAQLEDMPHSIHLFLQQVSHGLYDNTVFHRNAPHILQAGPHHNHAKFRHQPSLQSVLFQEYSPQFPHAKYTIGYPGRPGGPDFYINVQDNSELHGPGGQSDHYNGASSEEQEGGTAHSLLQQEADPCFAKVVEGTQVIERLRLSKVDWQDVMVEPVVIQHMRVLTREETRERTKSEYLEQEVM